MKKFMYIFIVVLIVVTFLICIFGVYYMVNQFEMIWYVRLFLNAFITLNLVILIAIIFLELDV